MAIGAAHRCPSVPQADDPLPSSVLHTDGPWTGCAPTVGPCAPTVRPTPPRDLARAKPPGEAGRARGRRTTPWETDAIEPEATGPVQGPGAGHVGGGAVRAGAAAQAGWRAPTPTCRPDVRPTVGARDGNPRRVWWRAGRHSPVAFRYLWRFRNGLRIPHSDRGQVIDRKGGRVPGAHLLHRGARQDDGVPPGALLTTGSLDQGRIGVGTAQAAGGCGFHSDPTTTSQTIATSRAARPRRPTPNLRSATAATGGRRS